MKIDVLTLFPKMFESLDESVIGRAQKNGLVEIRTIDIRSFTKDKHNRCDDTPFGGGPGMVMSAQPICDAFDSISKSNETIRIYLSPKGKVLNNELAKNLAKKNHLILLCGHYEGIDQRAIDLNIDQEISVGDYVLTGGELPAMILIDAVSRFIPGVLGCDESADSESFENNLLEYPHYTRPQSYNGLDVPEVLLSGHHDNIIKWRTEKSREITKKNRPDLLDK